MCRVDWDGENFGLGAAQFNVWEWEGTMKITKLSAYPLEYHPNLTKLKEVLITRGKAFEQLSGYHYKDYQGIAIGEGPWGPVKYNVSGVLPAFYSIRKPISPALPQSFLHIFAFLVSQNFVRRSCMFIIIMYLGSACLFVL